MKQFIKILLVLAAAGYLFPGALWAEVLEGEVTTVDIQGNSFGMMRQKPEDPKKDTLNIIVDGATRYDGLHSLADLQTGYKVRVEAEARGTSGAWQAKTVAPA